MACERFSFRGLMAPVFTPFYEDKNLNLKIIPDYAKYLHSNNVKGVLVNGTTGEGVSLTTKERKDVLEAWVNASQTYNLTIMVQVGGTNIQDVKDLARHAERSRVSSILCLPDLFFRPSTVDDLIHYLNIISNEAPETPLLYYHIPSFTGVKIDMKEFLTRSKEIPTFSGIKFTDNDLDMGASCVQIDRATLPVFLGWDTLLLSALIQDFDSAIGTTINIYPALNNKILRYFYKGDVRAAAKIQTMLNHNIKAITERGSWVSSMKAAMRNLTPINVGPVRDPLIDVKFDKEDIYLM